MGANFSLLINLIWKECIQNLNNHLNEQEQAKFSNNDYYYLLVIQSMGKPILSEVAESLQMTRPAVTAMVRKLQQMGLLEKEQSEIDKRYQHVFLSQKGEEILRGDHAIYQWVTDTIEELCKDNSEKERIAYIIQELVNRLTVDKEEKENDFLF